MFNPGKNKNFLACLRRTMQYGWFGNAAESIDQFSQPPTLCPGEFVTQINPANTGVVNLLGADGNGQVVYPMQVSIPLTAAQIITLNSAPVQLIAAPGAGFAILLEQCVIEVNRTSTQFTGGGVVNPVYAGATGTSLTAVSMAAADITGTAGQIIRNLPAAQPAGGLALTPNTAVQLFAGTANFAAGTGTASVFVAYSIVTL